MTQPARQHWIIWSLAALVFVVSSLSTVVLWRLQDRIQLLAISDNSMQPTLARGDIVLVKVGAPTNLNNGDIVSYRDQRHPGTIIIHRLEAGGGPVLASNLLTKGDAAVDVDPAVSSQALIGTVRFGLPKLGYVLTALQSPLGLLLGSYLPALVIVWVELRSLVWFYGKPTYELVAS